MKATNMIKRLGGTALVAAALVFSSSANADLVTQLIHFDDASNGWKWYSDADNNFLFDPTNLQSSILCADSTDGGNGSCVIEATQEDLPLMTRPEFGPYVNGTESQGHANKDPDTTEQVSDGEVGDLLPFTLDSFYFLLTGNGTGSENAITVAGSNALTFTFELGGTYATNPAVTFYEGANAGDAAGVLDNQIGYIASFGELFAGVTWIQFSAPDSAQLRLDCVVSTFDGTTTQPLSSFSGGCGGGGTQVPEPGTLALLGIGLFGMGLARRRRSLHVVRGSE